ncbi:hypothetical protein PVAP13_1NG122338 [Panicum virgatum]|uniref:Transposase n=1 Tax=Panicum virgatum TaxID=38727 RepID=A0A8T0WKX3_PANVG|nr:hypothetical protein PVAP13_1NG122338 [Panicum virgatum]
MSIFFKYLPYWKELAVCHDIDEEVSPRGKPILPERIWARFWHVCGAIAGDQLQTWITTNDWKKVPDSVKKSMWAALQACFRFPKGKPKEDARKFMMITLRTAFRNFRHTIHKDYVKKGLSAKSKFRKIPDMMWEEFKLMKNVPEGKALSQQMTEKAQKAAENPYHLGVGGYNGMIPQWRRERKKNKGKQVYRIRLKAFLSMLSTGGKVVFENPATAKLYERLAQIVEDQLTAAIGTLEHSGRVRGVSSSLPWKQAFPNDPDYRKRDRYKKDLEENMRAITKEEFSQLLARHVGSTTQHWYPVDDIQVDTTCTLVVSYRRKLNKFQEVATAMAVTVIKVMDSTCELDITTDDGIEVLGDAINQYVQWHRRDNILQGCLSQELQP